LAKPALLQSPLWQITSLFKYEVLTWVGIVGSAITLFANLQGVLDLADWARELVDHWHEWNQIVWGWVFSLIRVKVPQEFVPVISFTAFAVMLVIGVNLSFRTGQKSINSENTNKLPRIVRIFGVGVLLYLVTIVVIFAVLLLPSIIPLDDEGSRNVTIYVYLLLLEACIVFPVAYLLYCCTQRGLIFVNSLLL